MAEELKHKSWDLYTQPHRRTSVPVKYPWAQWLNGSMWYLVEGEDYDIPTKQFQGYIYRYCSDNKVKVKTKVTWDGKALYIKAIHRTSKRGLRRQSHFQQLQNRYEELERWRREDEEDELEQDEQAEGS